MADTSILEQCLTFGPWGLSTAKEWIYIPEGFIKKICISHGTEFIHSIEFHSESSDGATKKIFFGGDGGKRKDTVIIDYPDEYITSISGKLGSTSHSESVSSLYFHTNQNSYGPYGCGKDSSGSFFYSGKGGVIVGFHGCFGNHIESIGLYVMPKSLSMDQNTNISERYITFGPTGCKDGETWIYAPEGFIKKIRISHGNYINSIEFQSYCGQGASQKSRFGGEDGRRTDMICIDYPDEYLTSISGSCCLDEFSLDLDVITSLCFHTNRNSYGPYGDSSTGISCRFSFDYKGGVIVGFHGHFGECIDSIGVYVMPKSLALNLSSTSEQYSRPEKCCRMAKAAKLDFPRDAGPWGFLRGKVWDDGVFSNIKQVRVQLGYPSKVIFGIQFKYVKKDGDLILSRLHGETDGDVSEVEINLDGVEEYLTGICGFYGPVEEFNGLEGVTSITFLTNKGKHGPYGLKSEGAGFVSFASTTSPGKVVGFHGRNDDFLTAIGVHMEYF